MDRVIDSAVVHSDRNLIDMTRLFRTLTGLGHSEEGQALSEFTLVLAFIALVCFVALGAIGTGIIGPLTDFAAGVGGGGGS